MGECLRVFQIMGKMIGGGVESVVMNYYRYIDRDAVQFDFVVDADSTLVPREEISDLGGRVFEVPPYQELGKYRNALFELFTNENDAAVHSHINTLSVFPLQVAKQAGMRVRIAHSHSTAGKGELAKNLMKYALRPFANVYPTQRLACSQYAGKWLFGNAPFDVMRNAIELDKYYFDPEIRREVRSELGLGDKQFLIGHVGRFTKQKNQEYLLDVFYQALTERSDLVLAFIGDGTDREKIESKASSMGLDEKVLFLGQQNDVHRYYQAMDLFVLPSLYEGLGMVAIEAQAAGLPCLVSEAVPHEAQISPLAKSITLQDKNDWVKGILEQIKLQDKKNKDASINRRVDAGLFVDYDIYKAAPKLVDFYQGICR